MSQSLAIVTGATSGIGQSLTQQLADQGIVVLAIGRNADKLAASNELPNNENIIPQQCDITDSKSSDIVKEQLDRLKNHYTLHYLVHCATVLDPIGKLTDLSADDLNYQLQVNITGPAILTNACKPYFDEGARVLFISSGVSRAAIGHVIPHCAAKAAQATLAKGYKDELEKHSIHVGIAEPGIVDTPAQAYIRSLTAEQLPFSEVARNAYNANQVDTADNCAQQLATLLCQTSSSVFSGNWPWDLTDHQQFEQVRSN